MPMGMGTWATRAVATALVATDGTGDFTDIQAAIDSLPVGGGVVYIKEGNYPVTASITIAANNIALIGAGRATYITTTADISVIFVGAVLGVLIRNLFVYGAGAGNPNNDGILFQNTQDSFIEGCWIENCGRDGISIAGVGTPIRNTIRGCFISNNVSQGIHTGGAADNTLIASNHIHSNTLTGVYIDQGDKCLVVNNTIVGNGTNGVWIDSSEECIISGNYIESNGANGIWVFESDDTIVTGNSCIDNDSGDLATYDGIRLSGTTHCDNNLISSNRCKDNDNYEINVIGAICDDNLILGNICIGADHVGTISDTGTDTRIAHNIET